MGYNLFLSIIYTELIKRSILTWEIKCVGKDKINVI